MQFNWLLDRPIAHRGFWGEGDHGEPFCAENSLTAYQRAIEHNYNIEIDVHLLPDGNFAVFHDGSLKRVCGVDGKVNKLTTAELKNYHLSGTEDTIPTLQEVLDLVNGQVGLLIEMKDYFDSKGVMCAKLYEALKDYKGNYAIQTFNFQVGGTLKWWRDHTKDIPLGVLSLKIANCILPSIVKKCAVDFIAYDVNGFPNKFIQKKQTEGIKLLSWTIRSKALHEKAVANKVDNIIFDTYRLPKEE